MLEVAKSVFSGKDYRNYAKAEKVLLDAMKKASEAQTNEKGESKEEKEKYSLVGSIGATRLDNAERSTQRMDNLEVAKKMSNYGYPTKAVRMATGWERGADGKWRYKVTEIELLDGSGIPHTQSADFIPTSNNSITLTKLLKGVKKNNSSKDILSVSQIVDANGEPMPVYHGTIRKGLRKFNSFDTAKPAWFAYHKDYAEIYNRTSSLFKFSDLYSVFLNIREPLIIPSVNYSFLDEIRAAELWWDGNDARERGYDTKSRQSDDSLSSWRLIGS
jgi:hypothetical protein